MLNTVKLVTRHRVACLRVCNCVTPEIISKIVQLLTCFIVQASKIKKQKRTIVTGMMSVFDIPYLFVNRLWLRSNCPVISLNSSISLAIIAKLLDFNKLVSFTTVKLELLFIESAKKKWFYKSIFYGKITAGKNSVGTVVLKLGYLHVIPAILSYVVSAQGCQYRPHKLFTCFAYHKRVY